MKVTLGVLLAGGFPVPAPFVMGLSLLQQTIMAKLGDGQIDRSRVFFVQHFPVDFARNFVCTHFLDDDDGDYLLFLDADMRHPPDLAHRLIAHGVDVVTARYTTRKPPFFSVAMRKVGAGPTDYQAIEKLEPDVRGLMPVDAGGAGALLISRRALADIRAHLGADDWFRYQDGPDGLRSRSEDMWFYEAARATGYQPYLDADLHCTHVAQIEVDYRNHQPYADAFRRATAAATVAEKLVLDEDMMRDTVPAGSPDPFNLQAATYKGEQRP